MLLLMTFCTSPYKLHKPYKLTLYLLYRHNLTLYKLYISFSQPHPAHLVHTIYTSWLYNITLYKL